MAESKWAASRFRLWAEIGGQSYTVVQYSDSFELNTIPMATLSLAVGRDISDMTAAEVHSRISKLKVELPAKVFLEVTPAGKSGIADNFGAAEIHGGTLIFEGTTVGTGWQRGQSGAHFLIHLQHWLADLNNSSAVSGSSHPSNPMQFTFASNYPLPNADLTGSVPNWTPMHSIRYKSITRTMLQTDFWNEVLRPWMEEVAQRDTIHPGLATGGENTAALRALARMGPTAGGAYKANMGMDLRDVDGTAIGNSIAWALGNEVAASWVNTTLWGKLVGEWAQSYRFHIVPRVHDAIVAPATGGLRGGVHAQIYTSEYAYCDLNGQMPQTLRAVGVTFPVQSSLGSDLAAGPPVLDVVLYPPAPTTAGMVLLKEAPHWLTDPVQYHLYGSLSAGVSPPRAVATAMGPGTDAGPPPTAANYQSILGRFAQQWFVLESLRGRVGELSGKLRYDIAPGSQVLIHGGQEQFIRGDGLGENIYATVVRVSSSISAEARKAGTSFTLAHLRNEQENGPDADTTSVARPPLYKEGWYGAPLIAGF